jgi:hypothetical protein
MFPLRAYLLLRLAENDWQVSTHRDLETLIEAWNKRRHPDIGAAVHVGFWRPDSDAFESSLAIRPGKVVITAAAKFALPPSFKTSTGAITKIEGIPVHLGLSGWGYEAEADLPDESVRPALPVEPPLAKRPFDWRDDWLGEFGKVFPTLYEECMQAGVEDDATYLQLESQLSPVLRERLGKVRFEHRCGGMVGTESIYDHLEHAPPWMLNLPVSMLMLSTRSTNVMSAKSITLIGDLARYGSGEILEFQNLGRKSFLEIGQKLLAILAGGPSVPQTRPYISGIQSTTKTENDHPTLEAIPQGMFPSVSGFRQAVDYALGILKPMQRKIMELRMGANSEPLTLNEIGEIIGVTRERIRQIEAKAIPVIKNLPYWDGQVYVKLASMLDNRRESLPFEGIDILDPWFEGIERCRNVFEYVIENFPHKPFYLVEHEHIHYLTDIKPQEWLDACRAARKLVEGLVDKQVSFTELRQLVEGFLIGSGENLREELWDEATKNAHFANGKLVSYGFGSDHIVKAILEDSDRPLHYSEVHKILQAKGGDTDIRRCQNSCANVGLLLGRGTYGTVRHYHLKKNEVHMVVAESEGLIESGEPGRQWHARELCDRLEALDIDCDGRLNTYTLNVALKQSTSLNYLGRMIWASSSSGAKTTANRLDIHQAIVSVLKEAGRPLSAEDIKSRLLEERGLNCYFQIQPEGDLMRLGQGFWGLMDRDLPFSKPSLDALATALERLLRIKGKGLHVSEIMDVLTPVFPGAVKVDDPFMLFGIAQKYPQFGLAKGQYLYLAEWGEARRYNMTEAIVRVLKDAGADGLTLEEGMRRVEILIERPWPKGVFFGQNAFHHGGVYVPETARWRYQEAESTEEDI